MSNLQRFDGNSRILTVVLEDICHFLTQKSVVSWSSFEWSTFEIKSYNAYSWSISMYWDDWVSAVGWSSRIEWPYNKWHLLAKWKAMWAANRKETTRHVFIKRKYLNQLLWKRKKEREREKSRRWCRIESRNSERQRNKLLLGPCAVLKHDIWQTSVLDVLLRTALYSLNWHCI
jgi:hypothetical protein